MRQFPRPCVATTRLHGLQLQPQEPLETPAAVLEDASRGNECPEKTGQEKVPSFRFHGVKRQAEARQKQECHTQATA